MTYSIRWFIVVLCSILNFSKIYSQQISSLYGELVYHTVQKGDTLFKVALKYNCSYPHIARANGIKNSNLIQVGTTLVIPTLMVLPKRDNQDSIIINIPEFRLYHFKANNGIEVYPICVGRESWQTPIGTFEIINKAKNPAWYVPKQIAKKLHLKKEIVPPGPLNPLGDTWIGLSLKHIGIHSTNQPMSIGRALSHGCIRLYPKNAKKFFSSVSLKEKGSIIYEPIKVAIWQENVYVEVHPDIYQLIGDYEEEFLNKCKNLEIDINHLEMDKIKIVLKQKRGIPVIIGKVQECVDKDEGGDCRGR